LRKIYQAIAFAAMETVAVYETAAISGTKESKTL